jgi:hypothetical protein
MKTTIRTSVFETNSSSMHSFIYVSKDTLKAWENGEKILKCKGLITAHGEDDLVDADRKNDGSIVCRWECTMDPLECSPEGDGGCFLREFVNTHPKDWYRSVVGGDQQSNRSGHTNPEGWWEIVEESGQLFIDPYGNDVEVIVWIWGRNID